MTHLDLGPDRVTTWRHYWKTIVAVIGAVVIVGNDIVEAVSNGYGDGRWDANDTVTAVLAAATAIGVYTKRNTPPA